MLTGTTRYSCVALLLTWQPIQVMALSLAEAEAIALQNDPAVAAYIATADAHVQQSRVADTLPDPKLRLGLFNLPTDSFDLDQEPTTQLRLGVQQMFPRGDSLALRAEQMTLQGNSTRQLAVDAERKLLRDVRIAYLNLYYQTRAVDIIIDNRALFSQLVDITKDRYAAGRAKQQDVISASLQLSRLDDRISKTRGMQARYRADLGRWLGDAAAADIDNNFPALPAVAAVDISSEALASHPLIEADKRLLDAARKSTDIARQDYKPGINAVFEYRKRFGDNPDGSERTDMLAAMVTMDIPLFSEERNDQNVAASEQQVTAARFRLDDRLRQLKQQYDISLADYRRASEREQLYRDSLLENANANARAALNAYQSGVAEFTGLMQAQITELDVKLDALRIRIDGAIAQAKLLYLTGEQP